MWVLFWKTEIFTTLNKKYKLQKSSRTWKYCPCKFGILKYSSNWNFNECIIIGKMVVRMLGKSPRRLTFDFLTKCMSIYFGNGLCGLYGCLMSS